MPAIAPPLAISPEDLHILGQWSRSGSIRAALVERAKILLLAAQGRSNTEIAHRVGCSRPTVILWRHRYTKAGLDGLGDQPRPGRPQTVRADRRAEILAATLSPPPEHLGVTHRSTRLLATELGVSHNTVARVWRDHDLKPWQTFKFSTDPQLEAKVRDVVGLYLHPPERAIVVCVDE
jgi:transposase